MGIRRWIGAAAALAALSGCDEPIDAELIVTEDEETAAAVESPEPTQPDIDDGTSPTRCGRSSGSMTRSPPARWR